MNIQIWKLATFNNFLKISSQIENEIYFTFPFWSWLIAVTGNDFGLVIVVDCEWLWQVGERDPPKPMASPFDIGKKDLLTRWSLVWNAIEIHPFHLIVVLLLSLFRYEWFLWKKKARTAQLVNDSLPCWEAQHLSAMLNELHGSLAIFSTRVAILGHFPLQRQPLFVYVIAWPRLFVNKSRSVLSLSKKAFANTWK